MTKVIREDFLRQDNEGTVPLSILIPVLNEEKLLPRILANLARLDVEVFILDSGSTDSSIEIAKSFGCQVTQGQWGSFSEKLNWGLSNLPFKTSWVMRLDADEYLSDEFIREIGSILLNVDSKTDGLWVGRRIVFLGKWLRFGAMYPLEHLRITRVGRAHYENRLMDEHVHVEGEVRRISADIYEEDIKGLVTWSRKQVGYAETECYIHHNRLAEKRSWITLQGSARWRRFLKEEMYARSPLFIRPLFFWFYRYVLMLGFLDGIQGFIFHFLQAFWYRFLIDSLILEAKLTKGNSVKKIHVI